MNKAKRALDRIDQIDGRAIGHVNSESDSCLIRKQTVTSRVAFAAGRRLIDDRNLTPVDLFRGDERHLSHPERLAHLPMHAVQSSQRFYLFARDIDPGNSPDKSMPAK